MLIRKLEDYDVSFHDCKYPVLLSPDFKFHIDFKEASSQFVIRDSISGDTVWDIPRHVMNKDKDLEMKSVIARFKWADNDHIQVIDKTGFERKV